MNLMQWLPFGKVPEISPQELQQKLGDVQIVDVRTPSEFRSSHIDGATNLPITQFSQRSIADLELDQRRPVVTICLSAHRSIPATRQLTRLGYDVRQLEGGMKAWWRGKFPVRVCG
ncbi:rhodanese-like domain-containing protein [Salinisphaera sp.]|uniref:rhodanese-like domain-containing protein n=1 Tax=Salinisphaera sp. TaxID=1914330 RepID=UPI000C374941|nr:rhodanese-like domain-containing protein [Salinisphaera sp.]MBS61785.1 rhodanese-like domain-containing protein [Salinisphaera sp.]|tara:strand:+ start:116 stop:463 length:348 start_codon:yes stop_codon:yes gene_type:complete